MYMYMIIGTDISNDVVVVVVVVIVVYFHFPMKSTVFKIVNMEHEQFKNAGKYIIMAQAYTSISSGGLTDLVWSPNCPKTHIT